MNDDMEVDRNMSINVHEQIPVMESDRFLLREIADAEDLLKVYSDKDAVPLFNSDNCANDFYFVSIEEMKDTMAFWKREYKEFYMPGNKPEIVNIPNANYIAVRGKGNPNTPDGEYQQAIGVLYAVAYTLKMSYKTDYKIEGFFEYVVPPLEGFWWQDNVDGMDYGNKDSFNWISVIRLPDFVTENDFERAVDTAIKKKNLTSD